MIARRGRWTAVAAVCLTGAAGLGYVALRGGVVPPAECVKVARPPQIDPDYDGCTVPPNVAPMNFTVREPGDRYCVRVRAGEAEGFVVSSRTPGIVLPERAWRDLLHRHRGGSVSFEVFVRGEDGAWRRFEPLVNSIAEEDIDRYVVYRRLRPVHNTFTEMGMYQRDLAGYAETPVIRSGPASHRCINCHAFAGNRPEHMLFHVRGRGGPAMILAQDGQVQKVDARTPDGGGPAGYPAWHPGGRLVAFSRNRLIQVHHGVGDGRDVFDYESDLAVYDLVAQRVATSPQIADPLRLETFPAWSPDGKYLYFCSAPKRWDSEAARRKILPAGYREVRYDLYRINYDVETGAWGEPECVLPSGETGLSISQPRVSPDGRLLLFCMHEYGSFPVYQQSCDLYMMDLATRRHWRLEHNSPRSDSWHCWSSNGRWIVFASKRRDGLFGRLYLSYIDGEGRSRKPLVMPQRDPGFYGASPQNFNAPELIVEPVSIAEGVFERAIGTEAAERAVGEEPYAPPPSAGSGDAPFHGDAPDPSRDWRGRSASIPGSRSVAP